MESLEQNESSDTLQKPGDVQVSSIFIYSSIASKPYDISSIWENISIFEDMSKSYIFGQITIEDTQNLIQEIPILLNDRIEIQYKTSSAFEFEKIIGYIIDIPTRTGTSSGEGSELYVLEFITPEFVRSKSLKVRKSYQNTFISDMVGDIYNQFLLPATGKDLSIAPTLFPDSKVVPNLSPIQSINWLSKWAQSPDYRFGASYMFFENRSGYHFTPLESLVDENNNPTADSYTVSLSNVDEIRSDGGRAFVVIDKYKPKVGNFLNMLESGTFASTFVYRDPIMRQTYKNIFNYARNSQEVEHINGDSPIHNDERLSILADSHYIIGTHHSNAFGENIAASRTKDTILVRNSQLKSFESMSIDISIPGNSQRTIGEVIFLNLPSIGMASLEDSLGERDKYISGRYLIHNLRHEISRKATSQPVFRTHMRVLRDSVLEKLPSRIVYDKTTIPT